MKKYCDISILFVLYDESFETIFKSLEKIKNFNIIIIDNKGDEKLKHEIENKYQIEKYFLSKKKKINVALFSILDEHKNLDLLVLLVYKKHDPIYHLQFFQQSLW